MKEEERVRRATTPEALGRILDRVDSGAEPAPDWIQLQGRCRFDRLPLNERDVWLERLHRSVRRGFRHPQTELSGTKYVEWWRSVASRGFHDFSEFGWTKNFDSPFVENYDYLEGYLRKGIDGLDAYQVYSAVLGTHDYTVEDFLGTELCSSVRTILEPMAGTAELAYNGHFHRPDFRYVMMDLDEAARDRVMARPWLEATHKHYLVADVLDEAVWKQANRLKDGESIAYIGKQSHHFFGPKQLLRLMELATTYADYFMLEVPSPTLVADLPDVDELSRPEMEAAGLHVALVDEPDGTPNPITHHMAFRLDAWDEAERRTLFRYRDWTNWQLPMLMVLAELLDLRATYFHSEDHEFIPVTDGTDRSDLDENVTFMMFTRK